MGVGRVRETKDTQTSPSTAGRWPPPSDLEGAPCRGQAPPGDLWSRCRGQELARGGRASSWGELGSQRPCALPGQRTAPSHGGKGWVGSDKNSRETRPMCVDMKAGDCAVTWAAPGEGRVSGRAGAGGRVSTPFPAGPSPASRPASRPALPSFLPLLLEHLAGPQPVLHCPLFTRAPVDLVQREPSGHRTPAARRLSVP